MKKVKKDVEIYRKIKMALTEATVCLTPPTSSARCKRGGSHKLTYPDPTHPACMGGSHRLNYTQHRNNQYLIKVKTIHNITITQIVELDCYVYFYILTSFNLFTDLHQAYQPRLVRIYEFHHLFEIIPNVQYFRHMGSSSKSSTYNRM